ncbi:hypothetical protein ABT120_38840 [Nonomuraea angiospora]|uniref:hypothetical protein n=1 Tax=Nonomuraea angiospora TaxID=46172 RepID=UPI003324DFD1
MSQQPTAAGYIHITADPRPPHAQGHEAARASTSRMRATTSPGVNSMALSPTLISKLHRLGPGAERTRPQSWLPRSARISSPARSTAFAIATISQ